MLFPKAERTSETVLGKHDQPPNCVAANSGACGLFEPAGQTTVVTTNVGANAHSGVHATLEQCTPPHYILTKASGPSKVSKLLNSIVTQLTTTNGSLFQAMTMDSGLDVRTANATVTSLLGASATAA